MYHCIVILLTLYIDTLGACIVPSLVNNICIVKDWYQIGIAIFYLKSIDIGSVDKSDITGSPNI